MAAGHLPGAAVTTSLAVALNCLYGSPTVSARAFKVDGRSRSNLGGSSLASGGRLFTG